MKAYVGVLALWLMVGIGTVPVTAFSHHSTSEFDQSTVVELEGEIVRVFWRNPHVTLDLATMQDGQEVVWSLEGSSVSAQRRRGLTEDVVAVGDRVRVAGYASARQPAHMLVNHLLLPSGQELLLRQARTPRWATTDVLGTAASIDPAKMAAARGEGIFRVWTWGRAEPGWWFFSGPERFPLTDAALASLEDYDEYRDNPVLKCIPPGMPATMGNPYPIQFMQGAGTIQIRAEEFDRVRTIHMNVAPGADIAPSPLGYSVGRWEDERTLVIDTNRINAPYFNRVGVRQSEAVRVHERFTLSEDEQRLDYELTVTDPATLTEPWAWRAFWIWQPGEEVGQYQCTVDG